MPPKIKITKEKILDAAIKITREKGIAGVNSRETARSLACSVQPIFRCFQNMKYLKKELYQRAEKIFAGYLNTKPSHHHIPFLEIGIAYIAVAKEEKNLFRLIFMSDEFYGKSIENTARDEGNQAIINMVADATGLNMANAGRFFKSCG